MLQQHKNGYGQPFVYRTYFLLKKKMVFPSQGTALTGPSKVLILHSILFDSVRVTDATTQHHFDAAFSFGLVQQCRSLCTLPVYGMNQSHRCENKLPSTLTVQHRLNKNCALFGYGANGIRLWLFSTLAFLCLISVISSDRVGPK